MKHIKKFNETKKDEKVKDQEVLFNAEVLVDKDEKPSFKTGEQEDQEKVKKEFDKLTKVKKFEAFIDVDIHIDNIDEVEIENEYDTEGHEEESEEEVHEVGCGCCDECTGQSDCECCSDCSCGESGEEHTMNQPKVMNLSDFMNSIAGQ
jgi:hypothetical protein